MREDKGKSTCLLMIVCLTAQYINAKIPFTDLGFAFNVEISTLKVKFTENKKMSL